MRTHELDRTRAATSLLLAFALAAALIAAVQGLARLAAPVIPLTEPRIAPTNVEASVRPAAPATAVPQEAPAPAGVPGSTALPAVPKARPADGRPMGDLDPQPPSNRAWKGGFDY